MALEFGMIFNKETIIFENMKISKYKYDRTEWKSDKTLFLRFELNQ